MFCEKCGANNPDNAQMCMSCGAPMSAPEMPKKNTKKTVIIVVAVLLVLADTKNPLTTLLSLWKPVTKSIFMMLCPSAW